MTGGSGSWARLVSETKTAALQLWSMALDVVILGAYIQAAILADRWRTGMPDGFGRHSALSLEIGLELTFCFRLLFFLHLRVYVAYREWRKSVAKKKAPASSVTQVKHTGRPRHPKKK